MNFHGACAVACIALPLMSSVVEALVSTASAQGVRIFRPITRSVVDQKRINDAARLSLRVVKPRLDILPGKAGARVSSVVLNDDRGLLLAIQEDGVARLWDLEQGIQLGGSFAEGLVDAVLVGRGQATEAIGLNRDGTVVAISPVGARSSIGRLPQALAQASQAVFSHDGSTLVVHAVDGWWLFDDADIENLANTRHDFRPLLFRDRSLVGRIVYRSRSGDIAARDIEPGSMEQEIGGCREGIPVTAGAFSPRGDFVVLGDRRGNICLKIFPGENPLAVRPSTATDGHDAGIRFVDMDQDGTHFATSDGDTVSVWSVAPAIRHLASFRLAEPHAGQIALDARRGWVFAGEKNGTVGIYSYSARESGRIASLISLSDGNWMVVDSEGRFDGPQRSGEAMSWAGNTVAETLPLNSFLERYFEPGLLAKLDDGTPRFLNRDIQNITEDGYVFPPSLYIEPVAPGPYNGGDRVTIRIRLEDMEYPRSAVSEIRLYHNGKLVPQTQMHDDLPNGVFDFRVRLLPGSNTFRAVGVGREGVEGPSAAATPITVPAPIEQRRRMRVIAIGINDYVSPSLRLSFSRNDASKVVSALQDQGKPLYGEIDAVTLLDAAASAAAIKEHISRRSASARDILVIFFAGHGYAIREEQRLEWYLFPYTPAWDTGGALSERTISRHGVSGRELLKLLTDVPERRVFLVLDSCRSGAVISAIGNLAADDALERKVLRRIAHVGGIHVLAAARANQDAIELASVTHGALTFLLLEGIRGKADGNGDREVTVQEVVEYATHEMPLLSRRENLENISQLPVGYSQGSDFGLAGL